ncbi:MAG: biotin--[acetyl-CoA-carboxylase] ligase [candidate division WOR-3 bacterium]|nr:MAG: biotin--[acetyl-CoA-carboxylase] ligase [candidate division WOR-3 bacterium]
MIVGSKYYRLNEIGSTNDYIKQILENAPEGTVVVADVQSSGRGSRGRSWYSPEGGLWMSVLLKHHQNCLVSLIAGVAICETFSGYGIDTKIKWPNDILLNDRKIAGILPEIVDENVILGVGINLNVRQFPDDLRDKASSIFIETKKHLDPQSFYHNLCKSLDTYYGLLKNEEVDALLSKWREYTLMRGRDVSIELPGRLVVGKVLDIDHQGGLIIMRADYAIEHIIAGDCRLLN